MRRCHVDDYPGQNQQPVTPPPPAYQPQAPTPAYQPPVAAPPQAYAPQPGAPVPAAPKKKTWLWVLLGLLAVGLVGCGLLAVLGVTLFNAAGEPADSIAALNQAALDGDSAAFEKYFDADSVSAAAYADFIAYGKSTEDYATLVEEVGEEEADRMLTEEILPEDSFVDELSGEFSLDTLKDGQVPFPEYTVSSVSVDNDTADLTIVTIEEGEEVTYVLGMVKETVGDEDLWRVKEIKNIADMLEDEL
jgi:hypothetical protein